jgi:hypothetical protein
MIIQYLGRRLRIILLDLFQLAHTLLLLGNGERLCDQQRARLRRGAGRCARRARCGRHIDTASGQCRCRRSGRHGRRVHAGDRGRRLGLVHLAAPRLLLGLALPLVGRRLPFARLVQLRAPTLLRHDRAELLDLRLDGGALVGLRQAVRLALESGGVERVVEKCEIFG